ncbi:hypothetical protein CK203_111047 [Vitis vinifera]|uniref:Metallo-beta-lactamase domain-containing protein n=1 Tax=Vitis vinifera TaxID=29760 RepID=A0A438DHF1_VITVI|nr:hypothetical protein CK203_111047 [Vitis vinifera]
MSTKCYSKIFVIGYNNHMNPVMPFYPYPGCYFIYQIRPLVCSSYIDLLLCSIICFGALSKGSHNTHFCFPQTLEAVKRICPKRALLVGMTHEFDHHKDNETLMEWSRRYNSQTPFHSMIRVQIYVSRLAFSGLSNSYTLDLTILRILWPEPDGCCIVEGPKEDVGLMFCRVLSLSLQKDL